jgi:hypothetical protein
MSTPSDQPQYQSQPQGYAPPSPSSSTPPAGPPAPAQPGQQQQPPAQGSYPPPAYQQTGPQAYAPYAAQPRQSAGLAGGIWGILLLAVGGGLAALGLIALIVALIVDIPEKSYMLYQALLTPGLWLVGAFLVLQFWATVRDAKK